MKKIILENKTKQQNIFHFSEYYLIFDVCQSFNFYIMSVFFSKRMYDVSVYSVSLIFSLNFLSLVWVVEEGSDGRGKENVICISAYYLSNITHEGDPP